MWRNFHPEDFDLFFYKVSNRPIIALGLHCTRSPKSYCGAIFFLRLRFVFIRFETDQSLQMDAFLSTVWPCTATCEMPALCLGEHLKK